MFFARCAFHTASAAHSLCTGTRIEKIGIAGLLPVDSYFLDTLIVKATAKP